MGPRIFFEKKVMGSYKINDGYTVEFFIIEIVGFLGLGNSAPRPWGIVFDPLTRLSHQTPEMTPKKKLLGFSFERRKGLFTEHVSQGLVFGTHLS